MSRIFWDSMLMIYLLEGNERYFERTVHLLARAKERGDSLFTSHLALGEVLAGFEKNDNRNGGLEVRKAMEQMQFRYLPFDAGAVDVFASLRGRKGLNVADSIHLACAASAGIDLFLTGDDQLTKLSVPNIHFIADFETFPL